jgi:hypothetical protein
MCLKCIAEQLQSGKDIDEVCRNMVSETLAAIFNVYPPPEVVAAKAETLKEQVIQDCAQKVLKATLALEVLSAADDSFKPLLAHAKSCAGTLRSISPEIENQIRKEEQQLGQALNAALQSHYSEKKEQVN